MVSLINPSPYYSYFGESKEAVAALIEKADRGDGPAAVKIGLMYTHGDSVEKDIAKAFHYTTFAAQMGIPEGILNLGKLYIDNNDVLRGFDILNRLCEHPSDHISAGAAFNLGAYFSMNGQHAESKKYYILAGKFGLTNAIHCLGISYAHLGEHEKAFRMWSTAASKGYAASMYYCGMSYINGEGVEQNKTLGLKYLVKSGRAGFAEAITELRSMYKASPATSDKDVLDEVAKTLK